MLEVGDKAPDFTLRDQHGEEVTLFDLRGGTVVLYFYPRAMARPPKNRQGVRRPPRRRARGAA